MPLRQDSPEQFIGPIIGPITTTMRVIYWIAQTVAGGAYVYQYTHGEEIQPAQTTDVDPPADEWRRMVLDFADGVSTNDNDDQQMTIDLLNLTNGSADPTWTDADYQQAFANWADNVWLSAKTMCDPRMFLTGARFYVMKFNPYSIAKPFAASGPPDHTISIAPVPGTGVGAMPPQCSTVVTEITAVTKHYGRQYLPTLAHNALTTSGRLTQAALDAFGAGYDAWIDASYSTQLIPVVPTTTVDRAPKRLLSNVHQVKIDDVVDIQRRRRHADALAFEVAPPSP